MSSSSRIPPGRLVHRASISCILRIASRLTAVNNYNLRQEERGATSGNRLLCDVSHARLTC